MMIPGRKGPVMMKRIWACRLRPRRCPSRWREVGFDRFTV